MSKKEAFRSVMRVSRLVSWSLCALVGATIVGSAGTARATGSTPDPLYRLNNPSTGDHLFTTSFDEVISAVNQNGYKLEGVAAKCFTSPQPGATPFYRLLSPSEHFYTASEQEAEIAVASSGYHREGTACWVYSSQVANTCPIYRWVVAGHHFYTQSWNEVLTVLRNGQASFEGEAAYAFPAGDVCPN
jgi:hypothetical protein